MSAYLSRKRKSARGRLTQSLLCMSILIVASACSGASPSPAMTLTTRPEPTTDLAWTASARPSATRRPSATATENPPPTLAPEATQTATTALAATSTAASTATASATAAPSPVPTTTPLVVQQLVLQTPDGLALAAEVHQPRGAGPFPGVVLAHMAHSSRESWNGVPETLRQAGYLVLTFDFRGHGDSEGTVDPPKAALDLTTALSHMRALPRVADDRIGLVGASMGGMASVIVAAANPEVRTVVAISTSPGAAGQNPLAVIGQLSPRPFLAIGCKQDPVTRPERVTQLLDAAGEPKRLLLLDCAAHANDILDTETGPELSHQIRAWLDTHLRDYTP